MNMYLEVVIVVGGKVSIEVVDMVVFGVVGELGIFFGYILVLIVFDIGELSYQLVGSNEQKCLVIVGGFLEVDNNCFIVIIEIVEFVEEIDVEWVEEVCQCAEGELKDLEVGSVQFDWCACVFKCAEVCFVVVK